MSHAHYGQPATPPTGPPPPPPPKPYSQDPSRTGTPMVAPATQQHRQSQHYTGQPPVPPHPSSHLQSPIPQSPSVAGHPSGLQPHQGYPPQYQQQQYTPAGPPPPQGQNIPTTFELSESITKHTTSDLSKLLSEPQLLGALAQTHPAYAASLQPLQAQIDANTTLASQISSLEAQLKDVREKTGQLMLQHTSLQTQWRRKQAEMDETLAPWGPRAMYQRLLAGINEQEAMLTAVQESFMDGGGPDGKATEKEVIDWIRRLREGAAALHKRREMRSRWDEGRVGGWR